MKNKVVISLALVFFEELNALEDDELEPLDDDTTAESAVGEEDTPLVDDEAEAVAENIEALQVSVGRLLRTLKNAEALIQPYVDFFDDQNAEDKADFLGSIVSMITSCREEATLSN